MPLKADHMELTSWIPRWNITWDKAQQKSNTLIK